MENIFEKQGIQFEIITDDMTPAVLDFMWANFFPHEPINRSLGITKNWLTDVEHKEAINDGSSIAALDKDGNIIGVRIGMRKGKSMWMNWMFDKLFFHIPSCLMTFLLPQEAKKVPIFMKLLALVGYDVWKMFDQLGCDQIYEDAAVCSARIEGVRGIGTELCRRTDLLAKELGCSHTYACVTGIN